MKLHLLAALVLVTIPALGQTTTCTTTGNTTTCTSNDINRQNYEAGQKVGYALGMAIANARASAGFQRGLRKYCRAHPEKPWHYYRGGVMLSQGTCPSSEDMAVEVAQDWTDKHRDWHRTPENAQLMISYLDDHRLDPTYSKSYDQAFKALKKTGTLN